MTKPTDYALHNLYGHVVPEAVELVRIGAAVPAAPIAAALRGVPAQTAAPVLVFDNLRPSSLSVAALLGGGMAAKMYAPLREVPAVVRGLPRLA